MNRFPFHDVIDGPRPYPVPETAPASPPSATPSSSSGSFVNPPEAGELADRNPVIPTLQRYHP